MVGVGAIAGTLSGGYTNAARAPEPVPGSTSSAASTAAIDGHAMGGQTVRTKTVRAAPESSPAAVVAQRFPAQWQNTVARAGDVGNGDNDRPEQVMAYAAEPARATPRAATAEHPVAASPFQLASTATAPMPRRIERPAQPKPAVLFNDAQLAAIKARLKLSRDQEQYWPQVEQALRAISWKLATQQQQNPKRPVLSKQAAMIDPNSPEVARLKSAAFPLIMSMRSDQKEEVRQLAHTMGLKQVAAMF
ncbi:MAG: hypothetical protein IT536_12690 [Hyphomicrobiales bacterium]|nr:hypothetical protein [Hyphomicrobiales bacterium]